ncbi:anthranilate phosphoribosyltransferase [Corynebacterium sp. 335C]
MTGTTERTTQQTWRRVLGAIGARREVPAEDVRFAMDEIMSGRADDAHVAAFAFGIFAKGITPAELDAAADGMLSFAREADVEDLDRSVDIVGTGGDGAHTVNISTMTSAVVAAAGTPVVKHGNRAASSKSGGADMLEAFGIDIADGRVRSPEHPDFRMTFLFAATYHQAMRFAGPVRGALGVPTLFNLLGPLTNPAQPPASLIGCAFADQMETMAKAFARRGQRVLVIRGRDGLDEVTVTAPTDVYVVEDGEVRADVIDPADYGMDYAPADALRGGTPEFNADVARRVWAGEDKGPVRDAVLLNAAAALTAAAGLGGRPLREVMAEKLEIARETLDSGRCIGIMESAAGR